VVQSAEFPRRASGNDTLQALDNDDVLHCGTGTDKADGGPGTDSFLSATHGCDVFASIP
jgi:RTX calcium-binding nonapeptide repeat (4 copies)